MEESELSEREKGMSVEEWMGYNARMAEERFRREGERMVGVFERGSGRVRERLGGVEVS